MHQRGETLERRVRCEVREGGGDVVDLPLERGEPTAARHAASPPS